MKQLATFTIILLIFCSTVSFAFDGNRKGFTMGFGPSVSPVMSWSSEDTFDYHGASPTDETNVGYGMNFFFGYNFDEFNSVTISGSLGSAESDGFNDKQIFQGFSGFVWYHYFGPKGKSWLTSVGIGDYYFEVEQNDFDSRFAFSMGVGYEFTRHIQTVLQYSYGWTDYQTHDFSHYDLTLDLTFFAY